ncbi:hypothetical protein IC235_17510 [Hymenobacter sp. BT664]|uniref:Uncharacterized protein n=1 Tax=Hymenobacter montanus TaxID=2771359 RepID=A0A927GKP6_9BACT|nr:hypothetical protein [Hymenobacter montanus]MBD2769690.1 hypothetical protein [Hymenobacter montanus]
MPNNSTPLRYRFDIGALVTGLKPYLLRKPVLRAYLMALASPVATLYTRFVGYAATTKRKLSYSGQKMAFERSLNDQFDPAFTRIRIINSDEQIEADYDFFMAENHQPQEYLRFISECPPFEYDFFFQEIVNQVGFIVEVPQSLRPQEAALNARIRQLKLAMVKYSINYV